MNSLLLYVKLSKWTSFLGTSCVLKYCLLRSVPALKSSHSAQTEQKYSTAHTRQPTFQTRTHLFHPFFFFCFFFCQTCQQLIGAFCFGLFCRNIKKIWSVFQQGKASLRGSSWQCLRDLWGSCYFKVFASLSGDAITAYYCLGFVCLFIIY